MPPLQQALTVSCNLSDARNETFAKFFLGTELNETNFTKQKCTENKSIKTNKNKWRPEPTFKKLGINKQMWRLRKNKMKKIITIVMLAVTMNAVAQKQNEKSYYTFCGKPSGDYTMSLDEFKKCKKELTPTDKNLKVISFEVSVRVIGKDEKGKKDTLYVDFANTDNVFSKQTNDAMEKFPSEKKIVDRVLIENVYILEGDKKKKVPGMVIKIK